MEDLSPRVENTPLREAERRVGRHVWRLSVARSQEAMDFHRSEIDKALQEIDLAGGMGDFHEYRTDCRRFSKALEKPVQASGE